MTNLNKCSSRLFPLFLAIIFIFSQFAGAIVIPTTASSVQAAQTETVSIVEWNFNQDTAKSTGGTVDNINQEITLNGANLNGYVAGFGTGSRAINSNGWHTSGDSYWMISFDASGYEDLALTSYHLGSGTGPKDFEAQYSLDGFNWTEIPNGTIQITGTTTTANSWARLVGLPLPEVVSDQEQVFVRWLNTSNVSINGGTVGSTGTNRIDEIKITGVPVGAGSAPIEEDPIDEEGPLTIKDARALIGQEVTVEGIANIDQGLLQAGRFSLYIQDEEAGIQLFNFNESQFPDVKKGDLVRATGVVGQHSGVTQITVSEVEVLENNLEVPVKVVDLKTYMNPAKANEFEGQLVRFEGYIRNINDYFNGGVSISAINEEFDSVDLRVWESTGIDLTQLSRNTWYEVTAISSRYNTSYQVLPRSNADIVKLEEQKSAPTTRNREFQVEIGRVVDGDTITLKTPILGATNVRFLNMDTAETYHTVRNEMDQHQMDFGKRAGAYLQTLLQEGDIVTLRLGDEPLDGYGRLLAEVISPSGVNTNLEMVRKGMAPTYFIYPFESEIVAEYAEAARLAREEGLGIWNSANPLLEMPFVFRAREQGRGLSRYVGNFQTKEYVAPDHYEIVPPEYRVFFTKAQAESLGYTQLQLSDQEAIDMDKNALRVVFQGTDNVENVTQNVLLNTTGSYGSTITWESSHPEVVAVNGEVAPPSYKDVNVTLTATIVKGSLVETKRFVINVKPQIFELLSFNFDADSPVATGGKDINEHQEITTVGSTITGYVAGFGNPSRSINSNGWNGSGESYWLVQLNTEGYQNVTLSSRQFGSNTGPRDFVLQYSLDNMSWVSVEGGEVTVANNWNSGVLNNVLLPEEANNQETVYVRWLNTSNTSINGGTVSSGGTSRIDEIVITANLYKEEVDIETPGETPEKEEKSNNVPNGKGPNGDGPPGHKNGHPGKGPNGEGAPGQLKKQNVKDGEAPQAA
mgnify:CR=1 FL=1